MKISSFTIKNSGDVTYPSYDAGIDIRSNNNYISDNNIINNGEHVIYVQKGINNTLVNNFISNNTFGIFIDGDYGNQLDISNILNNTISNNSQKGLYLSY